MTGSPWWAFALRVTGLGWYIAACVVIGIVAGVWLDRVLETKILFTLLGLALGSISAFWGAYKMVLPVLYGTNRQSPSGKRRNP